MPNFIIIGAAKAGTTSIYNYLRQHPQIYMSSVKEPRYFAPEVFERRQKIFEERKTFRFGVKQPPSRQMTPLSFQDYCAMFEGVENEIAVGEASTDYLTEPKTPGRIKKLLPDVKLIAILRDPAERAYSHYFYNYRDGIEKCSFGEILQLEKEHKYITGGFYYLHLKRYFDTFQPNQIKICFQEDLNNNPIFIIQDIFKFLSVDYTFEPQDLYRSNVSGIPQSRLIHNFVFGRNPVKSSLKYVLSKNMRQQIYRNISKYNISPKPSLPLEFRQRLIDIYRKDILQLQKLIDKDLSHWLNVN